MICARCAVCFLPSAVCAVPTRAKFLLPGIDAFEVLNRVPRRRQSNTCGRWVSCLSLLSSLPRKCLRLNERPEDTPQNRHQMAVFDDIPLDSVGREAYHLLSVTAIRKATLSTGGLWGAPYDDVSDRR